MGRPTIVSFVEYKHFQAMKMLNQSALPFKKRSKNMTNAKKKKMEEKKSIREIEKHVKNVQKPRKML